jgi:hypothetical protein
VSQVTLTHDMTPTSTGDRYFGTGYAPKPEKPNVQKNAVSSDFNCLSDPSVIVSNLHKKIIKKVANKKLFLDSNPRS